MFSSVLKQNRSAFRFLFSLSCILLCCRALPTFARDSGWEITSTDSSQHSPDNITHQRITARHANRTAILNTVQFNLDHFKFVVIDNPNKKYKNLAHALTSNGCIAGTNASYFHPDMTPLGLLISKGEHVHGQERAKLLSGIFATNTENQAYLLRPSEFKLGPKTINALQAGPFLIDQGSPVQGLNNTDSARRTILATSSNDQWFFIQTSSLTLAETAQLLSTQALFPQFPITRALNLDGGSSSALFMESKPEALYLREFVSIRSFIGIHRIH